MRREYIIIFKINKVFLIQKSDGMYALESSHDSYKLPHLGFSVLLSPPKG